LFFIDLPDFIFNLRLVHINEIFIYLKYIRICIYKMQDIFDTVLVCDECHTMTKRKVIIKEGVRLRLWECPHCHKQWLHPRDIQSYNEFRELKRKTFEVKLRQVGNSWAVSIPKEIIRFESVRTTKTICMHLDEPGKITISFTKMKKLIKR